MHPTGAFLHNKEISPKLACMKFKILNFIFLQKSEAFLVFIEIKHKIDLDATYFKLHLTIIKFPTLKAASGCFVISMECDCHIFSKCLVFKMKNPVFQLKCLVF